MQPAMAGVRLDGQVRHLPRVPQAKEAGMATRDRPGNGWTVVLRCQPVRTTSTARWPMLA